MRKLILLVSVGVAVGAAGIGMGVANAATTSAASTSAHGGAAVHAAAATSAVKVPPATVAQRRANERKDGDPRNPAKWGPAQFESYSVAARAVYPKIGATDPVAAQREGTTDTYQVIVKAQKGGGEYLVEVDYLTFTALSIKPVG